MPRIYLDNAATSWPKADAVYSAVDDYQRRLGAPAGRGTYREAIEVERIIAGTRRAMAELIRAPKPEQVVFTLNGTDALNQAIHGWLRDGDHVVTTVAEHNSVLRPLRSWESRGVAVTHVPTNGEGIVDLDDIRRAISPKTRLIAVTAASNVTGALQPIREIGAISLAAKVCFLVDAAQAAGHVPIDVGAWNCDLFAAPGHKGLLGPLGTGFLYVSSRIAGELRSTRQGGTGSRSDQVIQPNELPDKFESGNLNVPGIVGLQAGLAYLAERGVASLRAHEVELTTRLMTGLAAIRGVTVYGPAEAVRRVGVVSAQIAGYDPQEAAAVLDSVYSVQVRAGLHCAPRMHAALGTLNDGGTVRFSVGPFNTLDQIDIAVAAVAEFVAG